MLAKIESDKAGYEEGILLDQRGFVCEGTGENLFIVKDGVIATPGFNSSILGGINRVTAIQIARDLGYEVVERDVARGELYTRRRDLHDRHRRRADADPRDRRPAGRHGRARPGHARGPGGLRGRAARPLGPLRRLAGRGAPAGARSVTRIAIYDTTLRDGMQGQGMSLSVEEKVRVAHVLDDLGIPFIEAGFPASNPKEAELFERLEHEGLRADVCAFGMTRRRDTRRRGGPGAARRSPTSFAPVCTLVGKTWSLHLEKVVKVGRDENLAMIAESVAFLVAEGKRVIYDAEHFFDGWRDDPRVRARRACARRPSAGAENVTLCDTNGASLPADDRRRGARRASPLLDAPIGIHMPQRRRVRRGELARGGRRGRRARPGHDERLRRALRQREPDRASCPASSSSSATTACRALEGWTEAAHYLDELLNLTPDPNQPYVGKNAFAHKGGMHVAGVNADPATFEHIDPAAVGNSREVLVCELSGKGTVIAHAGGALDDATAARVVERVKELEHRGFQFEAADGSFDLLIRRETGDYEPLFRLESWRVISEKREDGRVQTEATIKIWVDGQRYVRVAEGNGPVNALDTRAARRDRRALSAPARHQARQLQGPHPRRVEGHRRDHPRAARRHRRHRHVGRDRRARERDRGELGRARGLARSRHGPHARAAGVTIPTGPARPRRGRGAAPCSRCCAPGSSRSARACRSSSARSRRGWARRHASAVSSGTAALHLALRAVGRERGRRGRHVAVLVRRLRQRDRLRARHARVRRHRPGHAQPRPGRGGRGDHRPHDGAAAGAHLRLPGRHARARARTACRSSRTRARRSAPCTPTARRSAAAAIRRRSRFYANKQLTTGEGGMLTMGSAEHKERVDSERNQGRAPDMDWLDHDRLGFNYRLTDIACALGLAQLERLDEHARRPRARGRLVPRGAGRLRGSRCRARTPAATSAAGSCSSSRSRTARPRRRDRARCASAASSPSRTCPRST